jgi:Icc-related predicted phosphoesterase
MRILASADVHGSRPVYEWLLRVARQQEVEAIVLAGDLFGCLDEFGTPEDAQRREASLLRDLLKRAGVPVLYVMGNDDLVELDGDSERVQSIHGRRVSCGRFAFVGYQYSLPFMGGTFEKPDADIRIDLAELSDLVGPDTVFVSHSPALGILDPGIGDVLIGRSSLREFRDANPVRAHVHGHSHAGFGRQGNHFNVASAARMRSMTIDLENMQHQLLGLEQPTLEL